MRLSMGRGTELPDLATKPVIVRKPVGEVSVGEASFARLAQHRRILLLQGPNGPFFARLGKFLMKAGRHVIKVNFNGGDDLFYREGEVVRFAEPMWAWKDFLRELLCARRIEAIVVFGACRRHHRIAARVAESLGVAFWVFEEGYVRPDYITLERGGVNAGSPLAPMSMDNVPDLAAPSAPRSFPRSFRDMALYSCAYFAAGMAGAHRYPFYRHHKPFGLNELALWTKAACRKQVYRWQERKVRKGLLASDHPHFFLVALQVYNDSQIRVHSPWRNMRDFIEWTIHSFAAHAPSDSTLVIKHHPMDRGHTNYAAFIEKCAQTFGVGAQVFYIHDAHLPSLLHRCMGLVTVNSTTGLQALFHRVPVIALGRCFYAKPGLTFQGTLDAFWSDPGAVDMNAFKRFRTYVVRTSQINSSFYADNLLEGVSGSRGWSRHRIGLARMLCAPALLRKKNRSMK